MSTRNLTAAEKALALLAFAEETLLRPQFAGRSASDLRFVQVDDDEEVSCTQPKPAFRVIEVSRNETNSERERSQSEGPGSNSSQSTPYDNIDVAERASASGRQQMRAIDTNAATTRKRLFPSQTSSASNEAHEGQEIMPSSGVEPTECSQKPKRKKKNKNAPSPSPSESAAVPAKEDVENVHPQQQYQQQQRRQRDYSPSPASDTSGSDAAHLSMNLSDVQHTSQHTVMSSQSQSQSQSQSPHERDVEGNRSISRTSRRVLMSPLMPISPESAASIDRIMASLSDTGAEVEVEGSPRSESESVDCAQPSPFQPELTLAIEPETEAITGKTSRKDTRRMSPPPRDDDRGGPGNGNSPEDSGPFFDVYAICGSQTQISQSSQRSPETEGMSPGKGSPLSLNSSSGNFLWEGLQTAIPAHTFATAFLHDRNEGEMDVQGAEDKPEPEAECSMKSSSGSGSDSPSASQTAGVDDELASELKPQPEPEPAILPTNQASSSPADVSAVSCLSALQAHVPPGRAWPALLNLEAWPAHISTRTSVICMPKSEILIPEGNTDLSRQNCVLYWCTSCVRITGNRALERAKWLSRQLNVPLVVIITIDSGTVDCAARSMHSDSNAMVAAAAYKTPSRHQNSTPSRLTNSGNSSNSRNSSRSWSSKLRAARVHCAALAGLRRELMRTGTCVEGHVLKLDQDQKKPDWLERRQPLCIMVDENHEHISSLSSHFNETATAILAIDSSTILPPTVPAVSPEAHPLTSQSQLTPTGLLAHVLSVKQYLQQPREQPQHEAAASTPALTLASVAELPAQAGQIPSALWSAWLSMLENNTSDSSSGLEQNADKFPQKHPFLRHTVLACTEEQALASFQSLMIRGWSSPMPMPNGECWSNLLIAAELLWSKKLLSPETLTAVCGTARSSTEATGSSSSDKWEGIISHLANIDYCRHVYKAWVAEKGGVEKLKASSASWLDICPQLLPLLQTASKKKYQNYTANTSSTTGVYPTMPYPAELCSGRSHDPLFNAFQLCLIDDGVGPKGLAAQYWLGTFMNALPTAELGFQMALLEASRHSPLRGDDLAACVLPLLLTACQFLNTVDYEKGGMVAKLQALEAEMREKHGSISIDQLCCSFC